MKKTDWENFLERWKKYFNNAELPLTFYYTDEEGRAPLVKPGSANRCIIAMLLKARKGEALAFDAESVGCFGGKRFLGFSQAMSPNFEYFLSCGIPGKMEGERYKKSPELVRKIIDQQQKPFHAPGRYIVFKRWDLLDASDDPAVVIFFANPDVLAGLFTLASFDEEEAEGVLAPFSSGCSSIVYSPYRQIQLKHPRPIVGMFDPSARPYVDKCEVSFAAPMARFMTMVDNMDESFLITPTWEKIQKRIP